MEKDKAENQFTGSNTDALISSETHEGKIRPTTAKKKPKKGGDETHSVSLESSIHGSLVFFFLDFGFVVFVGGGGGVG